MAKPFKIVDGREGIVFYPGIPEDRVTKLFYEEGNYNRAVKSATLARGLLKELTNGGTNVQASVLTYPNIESKINAETNLYPKRGKEKKILAVHMPHLGVDIQTAIEDTTLTEKIPPTKLLEQIIKLFKQIKRFNDAGYFHADIRSLNVMLNPETFELTIIDYGNFDNLGDVLKNTVFGYFEFPPEYLLKEFVVSDDKFKIVTKFIGNTLKYRDPGDSHHSEPIFDDDPSQTLYDNICIYAKKYTKKYVLSPDDYEEDDDNEKVKFEKAKNLFDIIIELFKAYATNREALKGSIERLYTFDSFCLANTMLLLVVPSSPVSAILKELTEFDLRKRKDTDWALAELEKIKLAAGGGRRSKTHRKRKGKGRRSTKTQ